MNNERRSGATRTVQPIPMLQETRYMSRDELLREMCRRPSGQAPTPGAIRPPRRGDGA